MGSPFGPVSRPIPQQVTSVAEIFFGGTGGYGGNYMGGNPYMTGAGGYYLPQVLQAPQIMPPPPPPPPVETKAVELAEGRTLEFDDGKEVELPPPEGRNIELEEP